MIWILGLSWAAQVALDADNKRLEVGEQTKVRLVVVGDRADHVPELPQVDGLRLAYAGDGQSIVSVNFKTQRTVTYTWVATALREGEPRIPAVDVQVDGETLQTNSLNFTVTPRVLDDDESFTAGFPVDQAWVGQVLVYSAELRTPDRIVDSGWTPPPFDGFSPEPGSQATGRELTRVVDGKAINLVHYELPLVVSIPGRREVGPSVVNVQVPAAQQRRRPGDFGFGLTAVQREVFASEPLVLEVRALPDEGRAVDRWTGLVGDFTVNARLSDATLDAGGSATLEVRIEGDGSLAGFLLPPASEEGFRAYDDAPELSARVDDGRFIAQGVYRRAIVPEQSGELVLPELSLQVFSPSKGRYTDLVIPELRIHVGEGEELGDLRSYSDQQAGGEAVMSLGDDILPIHAKASSGSTALRLWQPPALALLPVLGFLVVLGRELLAGRRHPVEDEKAALQARLAAVDEADLGELESLLRACLGLALDRPAAGIERGHLQALPEPLRAPCLALYEDLERARYGAGADEGLRERVRAIGGRLCG